MKARFKAIAAVDANWGIGKDGRLLARIPGDLKYFRELTLGKVIVVGRETLESFPDKKPLPGRTTVCMTRNKDYEAGCLMAHSLAECLEVLKGFPQEDVFIAGGESVYRQFLPYCDACFITKIDASFPADRYFVNLDADKEFELERESGGFNENGFAYKFARYSRADGGGLENGENYGEKSCSGSSKGGARV